MYLIVDMHFNAYIYLTYTKGILQIHAYSDRAFLLNFMLV